MTYSIRRMVHNDVARVHEMEENYFKDAWSVDSFKSEVENDKFSFPCVMLDGERIIGYAVVWYYADEVHISNLAIDPDYRNKGLGSQLLRYILDRFDTHSGAYLEVRRSNTAALKLYRKFGFREILVRYGYYQDGEDAIVMARFKK